jgi:hypothetical protein
MAEQGLLRFTRSAFAMFGMVALICAMAPYLPSSTVPLVLVVVVVALALALATTADGLPADTRAALVADSAREKQQPARQCDPDAAGHARPRAPGFAFSVCR